MPRLSRYQSSMSSGHPLADLRARPGSSLALTGEPIDDSVSEVDGNESTSLGSSLGGLSLSLSHVADWNGVESGRSKAVRVRCKRKTQMEFAQLRLIQELSLDAGNPPSAVSRRSGSHQGGKSDVVDNGTIRRATTTSPRPATPIAASRGLYVAKFSPCGNYLAVAGEDGLIRIWKLLVEDTMALMTEDPHYSPPRTAAIFQPTPLQILAGHESSVLDVCWSRNNFLLSASMDKTVRLWHYSRDDCLGVFRHPDFVTSVAFHPRDDRMFITGSLDCRLRLWSIAERAVKAWNELPAGNYITAVCFSNSGRAVFAGTHTGVCLIFETEGFTYSSQIHVHSRRGKNSIGRKICGIVPMPGNRSDDKILISSNDSRIRLYTLRDKSVVCKFIGYLNESSQIRASFSDDGEYVISGSEDKKIFLWSVENSYRQRSFFSRTPSTHVKSCEYFETHSKAVPCAVFAPSSVQNRLQSVGLRPPLGNERNEGQIIVAVDLNGKIKVYENNRSLETWLG